VINPGLITVASNSLNPSGSSITVAGTPVVNHDEVDLTGALTLGGLSMLTLDLGGLSVSTGGAITLIKDGSRTGTFSTVTLINNPLNLQPVLSYTATTVTVNLVGAADHLAFGQQPTTSVAGVAISPAITVLVLDQFNNLVVTDVSNVTVALGANPGSGT